MKAYLFGVETGLYEGETFEEPDMIQNGDGITLIPPPESGPDMVPVFDRAGCRWTLIPVATVRRLLRLSDRSGTVP